MASIGYMLLLKALQVLPCPMSYLKRPHGACISDEGASGGNGTLIHHLFYFILTAIVINEDTARRVKKNLWHECIEADSNFYQQRHPGRCLSSEKEPARMH
jgi:hypothetical protein